LALDKALRTDADGRFEIPKILDADGEYQAVVRAAGFVPAHTAWKRLVPGQVLQWKEVQLGILRSLEGQVVDRRGQPVPGAKVVRSDSRSVERATTDAAGHFNLNIVVDRPGFVFVEARGFRFHGQVNDNTRPVRVTLVRSDETVGSPMKMLPLKLSKLERHALAEKLIEPQLNRGLAKDDDGERFWWLEWLAATDPARVLEMLEKRPLHEVQYDGLVRRTVAKRLVKESLEEARTVVDSIRDAGQRAEVYLELFDALSWERSEERKTLLAQVLLNARAIGAADQLTYYSGRVADRLLTVGDRKRGAEIIQETLESARKLPMVGTPGYYRTSYATCLSRFDLPAALELIKDLPDS
jgi:hypothetical protein